MMGLDIMLMSDKFCGDVHKEMGEPYPARSLHQLTRDLPLDGDTYN